MIFATRTILPRQIIHRHAHIFLIVIKLAASALLKILRFRHIDFYQLMIFRGITARRQAYAIFHSSDKSWLLMMRHDYGGDACLERQTA